MAALTFADLEIRSVFSIEKILSCHFETAENEHARLHFTAQVECRQAREEIEGMLSGQKVSLHGRGNLSRCLRASLAAQRLKMRTVRMF